MPSVCIQIFSDLAKASEPLVVEATLRFRDDHEGMNRCVELVGDDESGLKKLGEFIAVR